MGSKKVSSTLPALLQSYMIIITVQWKIKNKHKKKEMRPNKSRFIHKYTTIYNVFFAFTQQKNTYIIKNKEKTVYITILSIYNGYYMHIY